MCEDDKNENIISHLEALRGTLLKCLWAILIVMPFTFFIAPKVLHILVELLLNGSNIKLNFFSPVEVFLIQIKIAFVIDFIICFPYMASKIWDFILPALYEHEKKLIKFFVIFSTILFLMGVVFCLFLILPLIIKFGMSFQDVHIQAMFGISNIINLTLWMCMVFGLMFQIPLITIYLIKSGILTYKTVADKRPYVIVCLLIIAGFLTPPDVISQIILTLPTYILFEISLLFAKKKL